MKQKLSFRFIKKVLHFFTVSDIILVVIITVIAIFLIINNLSVNNDQFVRINYQNRLFGEYRLSEPKLIQITDQIEVEIADNKVRMLKNNCPNQICVEQGWSDTYPIICVPNQVEISIINKNSKKEIRHILK